MYWTWIQSSLAEYRRLTKIGIFAGYKLTLSLDMPPLNREQLPL